ncbi:MAG TPA: hypothetical protein VEA80_18100 [Vitreimonas sp.]|uniref:hypothetical protein n=1 Tax=Vitreimonas sp. TaxID=3069702 RepID=UPI002D2A5346|nr:hypothetical protein [Vitreimonas sp.]HYD89397.1 hypothetical protein [Vitreimonas sp.]
MINWTLRPWRSIGLAAAVAGLAACGQPAGTATDDDRPAQSGEDGERGEGGESGENGESGEGGDSGPG